MTVFWIVLASMGVATIWANMYFRRRHGVAGRIGLGMSHLDAGWPGAVAIGTHHVIARENARRDYEQADTALRRKRGGA